MTSTTIYLRYMAGPLVIGPISGPISLRAALTLVGLLCVPIPIVASPPWMAATVPDPAPAGKEYT